MKILLALFLVGCFSRSSAQRIFYTSRTLNKPDSGRPIRAIHPHWGLGSFASNVIVIYQDGRKQKISRDSIWGFEDTDHSIYRAYQWELYRVDSLANLIYYTNVTRRGSPRYFSKGLDTPLRSTKRAARADTVFVQP